jgi:tetratricopeptide (TPR) repeat protein
MNLLSRTELPIFSLLSIGQRGVGKTVFMAGCYAELLSQKQQNPSQVLWLECQNNQDRDNLEGILNYVAQTGQYPPPTMKITDFNFSLKQRSSWGIKPLCHFRWWDIPGEYCNFEQPEFQTMVLNSHSCCVFINAHRLVNDPDYLDSLAGIVKQVMAIASLIDQSVLKYAFALICTQCDQLVPSPISRLQIEENLQPLIAPLKAANAKYQRFYSAIPIANEKGKFSLKATGASVPFLWLVSELKKNYLSQSGQTLGTALKHEFSPDTPALSPLRQSLPRLALVSLGLLGAIALSLLAFNLFTRYAEPTQTPEYAQTSDAELQQYQQALQKDPNNFETLVALANLYIERGQLDNALPVMEKVVQQRPQNLDWQFNLAKLYELTQQTQKAETVYDKILSRDKNYFKALLGKAILRSEKGDFPSATALFQQAEQAAPSNEIKAKIRNLAKRSLKK